MHVCSFIVVVTVCIGSSIMYPQKREDMVVLVVLRDSFSTHSRAIT